MLTQVSISVTLSIVVLIPLYLFKPSFESPHTSPLRQSRFALVDLLITAISAILVPILMNSCWTLFSWTWIFLIFRQTFLALVLPATLRLDVAVLALLVWHGILIRTFLLCSADPRNVTVSSGDTKELGIAGNRFLVTCRSDSFRTSCAICMQVLVPPPQPRANGGGRIRLAVERRPQGVVDVVQTPCGHIFHCVCVIAWVKKAMKRPTPCPICARPIEDVKGHAGS
jgi:hypothetical protein